MFEGLFGAPLQSFGMIGDARAMSQEAIAQMQSSNAYLMANAKPSIAEILGRQNYRRPIIIPGGFAYWYEIGDDLQ